MGLESICPVWGLVLRSTASTLATTSEGLKGLII